MVQYASPLVEKAKPKKKRVRLSKAAEAILYLKGEPFSLDEWFAHRTMLDCSVDTKLYLTGRQSAKSTMMGADLLTTMAMVRNFRALYGCPDDNSKSVFSEERLYAFIDDSPMLASYLAKPSAPGVIRNVNQIKFTNGSSVILRNAARHGSNWRGPSTSCVYFDEIQDIPPETIPIALETMARSKLQLLRYAGTPKTRDNQIQGLWEKSTQNEWLVKCLSCSGGDLSHHMRMSIRNITPKGLICDRCGRTIHPRNGQWVSFNPGARTTGFRIPSVICPNTNFDKIYFDKLKEYPLAQFMNEVLGVSYDSAEKMFTEAEVREACNKRVHLHEELSKEMSGKRVFAGIDWGVGAIDGARTVLTIGYEDRPMHLQVVFGRIYPNTMSGPAQTRDIIENLIRFGVRVTAADVGGNGDRNMRLAEALVNPGRVAGVHYMGPVGFLEPTVDENMAILRGSKTSFLASFYSDVIKKRISFYNWEEFKPIADDMLAEHKELNSFGHLMYSKGLNKFDDALHSLVYLNLAYKSFCGLPLIDTVAVPKITESGMSGFFDAKDFQ